jgi:molybdenum cofactor cytidylyltransferase
MNGELTAHSSAIGIVILAAGGSSRLGQPKQLLVYQGRSLLHRTVDTALSVPQAPVIVVLGAGADLIRKEITDMKVAVMENLEWQTGMASSIRAGLSALIKTHPKTEAVILLLCDQPLLCPEVLEALIQKQNQTGSAIVASEYGNVLGVPALFCRSLFPELLALEGEFGARQVIEKHRKDAVGIYFAGGSIDIDTADDYARLAERKVHQTNIR